MIHRPFNNSFVSDNYFIKNSATERLADEIYYYQFLQQFEIKNLFAEFLGDLSNGVQYSLKLRNYEFDNFYENLKSKDFDKTTSFQKILGNLEKLHKFTSDLFPKDESSQINKFILIEKTEIEFQKFINKANILFDHAKHSNVLIINGIECQHFASIWPLIKSFIIRNYLNSKICFIHGDFCFANILHNHLNDELKFIDPRGSYHMRGCFGDKAYDYAKLLHSAHGNYEQIIYDDYSFEIKNKKTINYDFKHNFDFLNDLLVKKIEPPLFEKSKLIEGLLFISMCSRHYENEEHQFIMYCQGLLILNEFIKNQSSFSNY